MPAEAFDSALSWSGAWPSQTIGAWFVERRLDAGIAPDFILDETAERRLRRGRSMFVDVGRHEGWIIPKTRHTNLDHRAVLEDGRIVHAGHRSDEQAKGYLRGVLVERELQVGHLDDMARLLGLPTVEIRRTGVGRARRRVPSRPGGVGGPSCTRGLIADQAPARLARRPVRAPCTRAASVHGR